jgi:ATP adenylyltransferase
MNYILAPKHEGCIFCDYAAEERDDEHYIIHRGERAFVIMNLYPYNPGHVMIAPYRHLGDYSALTSDELLEMTVCSQRAVAALRRGMNPDAFNLGMNVGEAAGAGIADHLHLHVVPRWSGDTNFMPLFADLRVVPEAFEATFRKLKEAWS